MNSDKGIFQRAFNALIEGRSREARRYVDAYLADRKMKPLDRS